MNEAPRSKLLTLLILLTLLTLLTWRTLSKWFIRRYGVSEENAEVERSEVDTPFRLL